MIISFLVFMHDVFVELILWRGSHVIPTPCFLTEHRESRIHRAIALSSLPFWLLLEARLMVVVGDESGICI